MNGKAKQTKALDQKVHSEMPTEVERDVDAGGRLRLLMDTLPQALYTDRMHWRIPKVPTTATDHECRPAPTLPQTRIFSAVC